MYFIEIPTPAGDGAHGRLMYRNPQAQETEQPCDILLWHHFQLCIFSNIRASGPPPDLKEFDEEDFMQCPTDGKNTDYLDLRLKAELYALDRPRFVFDIESETDSIEFE